MYTAEGFESRQRNNVRWSMYRTGTHLLRHAVLQSRYITGNFSFVSFIKMHKGRLTTYNASKANKINL